MSAITLLVLVNIAGLAFDFINGFHDTANAIATVVSTGVMRLRTAVMLAAAGALFTQWERRSLSSVRSMVAALRRVLRL